MKATFFVYSSYHQIYIGDPEASFETDNHEYSEDMQYDVLGETLVLYTETYGDIEVTFQDYDPEAPFIYRGTATLPLPTGKIFVGDANSADIEINSLEVEGPEIELKIFNNRDMCASKIVLVTSNAFKPLVVDEPLVKYSNVFPVEADSSSEITFLLESWEGVPIPTAIAKPCENYVIAGDSEIIRKTGCQTIDEDKIFYAPVFAEDPGVRMHLLDAGKPLISTVIEDNSLILYEEKVFECPTRIFTVSDILGHRPYFTRELNGDKCKASIYVNADHDEDSIHTILFVLER